MSLITGKWIQDNAIGPQHIDSTAYGWTFTDATVQGGLQVDGTVTAHAIKTDIVVYNSLTINDNENEVALAVNQQNGTATATVQQISNLGAGTSLAVGGPAAASTNPVVSIAEGVGSGTRYTLDVAGNALFERDLGVSRDVVITRDTTVGMDLRVANDATVVGNLHVDGLAYIGYIKSEVLAYDRLEIDQTDNQEALIVRQTLAGATADVVRIENAGAGPSLLVLAGTGAGTLGVDVIPTKPLDVNGNVLFRNDLQVNRDVTVGGGIDAVQETVGQLNITGSMSVTYDATIGNSAFVAGDVTCVNLSTIGSVFSQVNVSAGALVSGQDSSSSRNEYVSGYLGVGHTNPERKVHIRQATAGAVAAHSDTQLVVENSSTAGISIKTPAANSGVIYFGDTGSNQSGQIVYNHADDSLKFYTATHESVLIDTTARMGIGISQVAAHAISTLAASSADDLVVGEPNDERGITIAAGPGSKSNLAFSNGTVQDAGRITYDHTTAIMDIWANGNPTVHIESKGAVGAGGRTVVSIGDSTPQTYSNASYNELVVGSNSGNHGITIVSGATSTGAIMFSNGSVAKNTINGRIQFDQNANAMTVWTDSTSRLRLEAATGSAARLGVGLGPGYPSGVIHGYTDTTDNNVPAILGEVTFAGGVAVRGKVSDSSGANIFEGYRNATRVFRVDLDGTASASAHTTAYPADFAEWCEVTQTVEDYPTGTVVQQSNESLIVDFATDPEKVYGVVTNRAAFCGGPTGVDPADYEGMSAVQMERELNMLRVAMVGHVQVRIKGPVNIGDRLTISESRGVAKSASTFEEKVFAFAIARESHKGIGEGQIEARLL